MASAGSKRGRSAWEDCEDVSELKQHLAKQQDQIEKLRKEKAELSKAVKAAEGVAADVPNLTLSQAKAVLGEQLVSKASNGAKKLEVKADGDDLYTVFSNGFSKSLRYGASLELTDGIKFSYDKTTSVLKLTGTYSMSK
ncbi:hypothetical protein WJX79_005404 [Trebouxia sp. C0005]